MTESFETLILEHLRAIRASIADIRVTLKDHTERLGRLETGMARIGRENADLCSEQVADRRRVDQLVERIGHIEHRLEISG
jgi:hypothetical protein